MDLLDKIKSYFSGERNTDQGRYKENAELGKSMKSAAEKIAEEHNLDFSPSSLKQINNSIDELRKEQSGNLKDVQAGSEIDKKILSYRSMAMPYLGEVVRRNIGGYWATMDETDESDEGISGIMIPLNEKGREHQFFDVERAVEWSIRGNQTLYRSYQKAATRPNQGLLERKKVVDEVDLTAEEFKERASKFRDDIGMDYSGKGLLTLDTAIKGDNLEKNIENINIEYDQKQEAVIDIAAFIGGIAQENLDVEIKKKDGSFIIYDSESGRLLDLIKTVESCLTEENQSLYGSYNSFKEKIE